MSLTLQPDKALIFRVTHVDNLPWILKNGLYCASSPVQDPDFVSIGNQDLIEKRRGRAIQIPPYGTLGDYVPFYFTPYSPMLYNITTGYNGITRRTNREIAILVSSLHCVQSVGCRFVFSDRHAYLELAAFSSNLDDLREMVPWKQLQERNFRRDPENPDNFDQYQAEALIHQHLPPHGLLGLVCYDDDIATSLQHQISERSLELKVHARPGWYFR